MIIQKEDLALTHYLWQDEIVGERLDTSPSRKLFDRNNGNHILWVINWYATEYGTLKKEDIARLEGLLQDKLPFGKLSEKSVSQWLLSI